MSKAGDEDKVFVKVEGEALAKPMMFKVQPNSRVSNLLKAIKQPGKLFQNGVEIDTSGTPSQLGFATGFSNLVRLHFVPSGNSPVLPTSVVSSRVPPTAPSADRSVVSPSRSSVVTRHPSNVVTPPTTPTHPQSDNAPRPLPNVDSHGDAPPPAAVLSRRRSSPAALHSSSVAPQQPHRAPSIRSDDEFVSGDDQVVDFMKRHDRRQSDPTDLVRVARVETPELAAIHLPSTLVLAHPQPQRFVYSESTNFPVTRVRSPDPRSIPPPIQEPPARGGTSSRTGSTGTSSTVDNPPRFVYPSAQQQDVESSIRGNRTPQLVGLSLSDLGAQTSQTYPPGQMSRGTSPHVNAGLQNHNQYHRATSPFVEVAQHAPQPHVATPIQVHPQLAFVHPNPINGDIPATLLNGPGGRGAWSRREIATVHRLPRDEAVMPSPWPSDAPHRKFHHQPNVYNNFAPNEYLQQQWLQQNTPSTFAYGHQQHASFPLGPLYPPSITPSYHHPSNKVFVSAMPMSDSSSLNISQTPRLQYPSHTMTQQAAPYHADNAPQCIPFPSGGHTNFHHQSPTRSYMVSQQVPPFGLIPPSGRSTSSHHHVVASPDKSPKNREPFSIGVAATKSAANQLSDKSELMPEERNSNSKQEPCNNSAPPDSTRESSADDMKNELRIVKEELEVEKKSRRTLEAQVKQMMEMLRDQAKEQADTLVEDLATKEHKRLMDLLRARRQQQKQCSTSPNGRTS